MRNLETWLEPALPLQHSRRGLKSAFWLSLLMLEGALQNVCLWFCAETLLGVTLVLPAALNMAPDRLNLTVEYHNVRSSHMGAPIAHHAQCCLRSATQWQ